MLHGTPPFQVYYRTQRDEEPPRDLVKTFPSSRGELNLQPEKSGHYVYTFLRISDADYKKVELNGPSIDQIVHPLAGAEFVRADAGARSKKMINSCSGNMVDVEVDLKVCQATFFVHVLTLIVSERGLDHGTFKYKWSAPRARTQCNSLTSQLLGKPCKCLYQM